MKTKGRPVLIFLSLCILAGCANIRNEFQEKSFYRIQAHSQMANPITPGGEALLVNRFSISPEFETNSFVYRLSPTRFATDFHNNFMVSPARMITEVIQEDLWASPLFSPVPTHTMADIGFQLWGKVTRFYGDALDPKHPKAVVTIRLILEKNTGDSFTPVINKTYEAQIELNAPDPVLLTDGLGKGVLQILDAFYADLANTSL